MRGDGRGSCQVRVPLFPGKTCFPLSADSALSYKSLHDQLNVIFDVIGTPSVSEVEGMDDIARKYLATLTPTPKRYVGGSLCCEPLCCEPLCRGRWGC